MQERQAAWPPDEIVVSGRAYVAADVARRPAPGDAGPEDVYTAAQVAEMAHVGRRTVYDAMERGTLAFVTPNGCTRPRLVRRSAYESWVGLS